MAKAERELGKTLSEVNPTLPQELDDLNHVNDAESQSPVENTTVFEPTKGKAVTVDQDDQDAVKDDQGNAQSTPKTPETAPCSADNEMSPKGLPISLESVRLDRSTTNSNRPSSKTPSPTHSDQVGT